MMYLLKYLIFGARVDKDGKKEGFIEGYANRRMGSAYVMMALIAFVLFIFICDELKIFAHWLSTL
jgi:hypothetical protein